MEQHPVINNMQPDSNCKQNGYPNTLKMKFKKWFKSGHLIFYLLLLLAALQSCKEKENEVKVVQKSFMDEVALQQNFNITFNRELIPDSLLDRWETADYFKFTPAIEGRFKWVSTHEIMFSPLNGLAPCTSYKLELNEKSIFKHADKKLFLTGDVAYSFHTAMLNLESVDFHWRASSDNAQIPALNLLLNFNYNLNPAEVLRNLKIESDGKTLNAKLIETGISATVHLEITDAPLSENDVPVKLIIAKGIAVPRSAFVTDKEMSYETVIPSKSKLIISNVQTDHNGEQGSVVVTTSEEVKESTISNAVHIQPNIEFTVAKSESGFTISSKQFDVNSSYTISIDTKLEGTLGGKLKEVYSQDIIFGKLQPAISFISQKGMYLGAKGNRNIAVSITSIPKVKVRIYKIYENNMIQFFKQGMQYNSHYDDYDEEYDEYNYSEYNSYLTEDFGDLIWEQDYETRKLEKINAMQVLKMDFDDKIKNQQGIYVMQIESADQNWIQASKILAISDIGLIVKESKSDVMVIANSVQDAKPLSGVKLNIISKKNQLVKSITTDGDGIAFFEKSDVAFPKFEVSMITAQLNSDYNFMRLESSQYYNESSDEGGGRYLDQSNYDAFLYGDRDIYRPGETMHISCIVRNLKWSNPGDLPVVLKIYLPNGREFKTVKKVLNKQGAFETAIAFPPGIVTGNYRVTVTTGDNILLASKNISVEEFMPDKISVQAKLNAESVEIDGEIKTNIVATNLFGPPASDRNFTMEMSLNSDYFSSKKYSDYNFNYRYRNTNFAVTERSGKTNQQGQILETFNFPSASYANNGLLSGKIFTTVFDESGRPVNRENYFKVYTQKVFIGLKYMDSYVGLNEPVLINVAAVTANDKPAQNIKASLVIIRREWQTVLQKVGNNFQYKSEMVERIVSTNNLVINEKTALKYTPVLSGDYEVRLAIQGAQNYVSQFFYAYGYGHTENTSFEVSNDGNIGIETDKKEYKTGETAQLLFKTPFAGKLIVTVEQNKVIEHFSINTDAKSAAYSLKIKDDFVPNIFISAILIRPADDGSNPLIVAHGLKDIKVENPSNKLALAITAVATTRSKSKQSIKIKTTPDAEVTVAVVDEGILQMRNYQTPDPYGYFYAPRALAVNSFDIYPSLFPELMSRKNMTGGGGYDLAKRVNPLTNKRVNLVALWSGILKADGNGMASFEINIPQFNGDLRIMAVSYKDNKFAGADAHMKVADPIVINTGLPRFTSPRDTVIMPVVLTNTTKTNTTATLKITATGPFSATSAVQSVAIKANSEAKVVIPIAVQNNIGAGKITCTVNALNETFVDETEMTARPAASLQKENGNGDFDAGQTKVLNTNAKFISSTIQSKLIVSRSPLVAFSDDLSYLIQYPYGCVEQTVSAAFPQIYYYDLAKALMKKTSKDPNPNYNVQQAIAKLQSMQLGNGAMSYWSGGGYESWFGTVYAMHFLLEAKKAGFDVDQNVTDRMQTYLINQLKSKETFKYYYNTNQFKEIVPKEIPYTLYVLALANKPQVPMMNYYRANLNLLSLDGKYMLAASFALAGNKLSFQQLLPAKFEGEIAVATTGGSFYSYLRDEAISLNALLEVDPGNPQIPIMARHVSQELKKNKYANTQERVFTFLDMGKIARMTKNSNATATIKINGKAIASMNEKDASVLMKGKEGAAVEITSSGNGKVYYFWETEGISIDGSYKAEDSYLKVRKTFYSRNGQVINQLNFKQNDLVVIKLSLLGLTKNEIENVVITDMLPAGFEIENPRISTSPDMPWITNQSYPQYQDFRDDRVNLFASATTSQQDFYYIVRCVTKGVFQMGPVSADAMYNGEYHSYNGAGVVRIQ